MAQIISHMALAELKCSLAGDSTALYTAVSRLNTKLTESGAQVTIRFLRGKGYTLEAV